MVKKPAARPAPAAFDANTLNDVLSASAIAEYKKKLGAAQAKSHDALMNQRAAKGKKLATSDSYAYAQRQQAMRQALAQQLQAQGRSPLNDELNARKRLIFGG